MRKIDDVSRETRDRLRIYENLLERWNEKISLTSPAFARNRSYEISESVALGKFLPRTPTSALDIGAGNGLPAIPLAIAFNIPYTLVEADRRKAAFLQEAARETGCPVMVEARRIEDLPLKTFQLVTARAFARLNVLLGHAYPRQAPGTICLFPKGANVDGEIVQARHHWAFDAVVHTLDSGLVAQISSIEPRT